MPSLRSFWVVLFLSVLCLPARSRVLSDSLVQREVTRYELPAAQDSLRVVLYLDYAKAAIRNPEAFERITAERVYQVDLVFTRYPYVFDRWRTDYDWLLAERLKNLHALDTALFARQDLLWEYILQTDCQSEQEAMRMFHGFVVHMHPPVPDTLPEVEAMLPEPPKPPEMPEALMQLAEKDKEVRQMAEVIYNWVEPLRDSSVYKVFERHPQWRKKLVIMDWTSSMYHNGSSVLRWHAQQIDDRAMEHLVLFNDGDNKPHAHKKVGKTGGIYHLKPNDVNDVMQRMLRIKQRGGGGDAPENDLEAVLKGVRGLRGFQEVVLIPDRNSSVRDIALVKYIHGPVRVVLFKNRVTHTQKWASRGQQGEDEWIHPHYLTIASYTKGSLHTHDKDFYDLHEMKAGDTIDIGWYTYEKQANGTFKVNRW